MQKVKRVRARSCEYKWQSVCVCVCAYLRVFMCASVRAYGFRLIFLSRSAFSFLPSHKISFLPDLFLNIYISTIFCVSVSATRDTILFHFVVVFSHHFYLLVR